MVFAEAYGSGFFVRISFKSIFFEFVVQAHKVGVMSPNIENDYLVDEYIFCEFCIYVKQFLQISKTILG